MSSCAQQVGGCRTSPVFQNPGVGDEFPSQPFAGCTFIVTVGVTTILSSSDFAYVRLPCSLSQFLIRLQLMYLNMNHYIWAERAWKSVHLHFPGYAKVSRQEHYLCRDS